MSHFSSEFFANNRKMLRQRLQSNMPIVVTANGSMQRAADEPYKFVQDSNFWYLTGLSTPDLLLVMLEQDTFLIAPELSQERQVFDGSHDVTGFRQCSGISTILNEKEGWQRLKEAVQASSHVATLESLPPFLARHRIYALPYRRRLISRLKRLGNDIEMHDIRELLASLRCTKQTAELTALQHAIDITSDTLNEVANSDVFQSATFEYQLEAAISYGFRYRGADGHAFEPIVGAGRHSTTLHHVNNDGPIAVGDMIVLDVGASVEHYAADISRTVSQKPFTDRQRTVFDAVREVQQAALELLRPGTMMAEYEQAVAKEMGKQLRALGLITGDQPDAIRRYFPHATSHFLGLDTHDVGDYRQPLAENMVLTCEPGIYIPEENIGVRIEDDVLLTKKGNTVLSAACPVDLGSVK